MLTSIIYCELFNAILESNYYIHYSEIFFDYVNKKIIKELVCLLYFLVTLIQTEVTCFALYADFIISTYDSLNYIYIVLPENQSLLYSFKFLISILFLIFIRAGIPRYRYDFLTKLGWLKFFLYTALFLVLTLLTFILF
jgi:NADH:ubiquinone oxidoreductase subunit H